MTLVLMVEFLKNVIKEYIWLEYIVKKNQRSAIITRDIKHYK